VSIELTEPERETARELAAATGGPVLVVEVDVEPAEPEPERELEL
jgi:hypothetical protein